MANRPSLDDYVDVAERIQNFKDTNPDGSLQTISWEVRTVGDQTFIVYHAAAYRTPDDPRPGHGISWEPFPGTTPYTKMSELMNAETAAWGRAIIATGEASKGSLASRQEVRNRRAEQEAAKDGDAPAESKGKPKPAPVVKLSNDEIAALMALYVNSGWDAPTLALQLVAVDALPSAKADELNAAGDDPEKQKAILGPAVRALTPDAYATVKSALEDEIARKVAA